MDARFPDWTTLSPDEQRQEAENCRHRLAIVGPELNAVVDAHPAPNSSDRASGRLLGLPYVTKDLFDGAGRRARWGGARPEGPIPDVGAEILERLDRAGATEIAVSSMTELAYEPSGFNAVHGRTLNPWHPDVVAGGSSSGSAAIVAAGGAVLGLGSDTGGSIRMPASCCGVTGLKPTHGAVPASGTMPLAPSLDTIGLLARSAAELELVWPVLSDASRPAERQPPTRAAVLTDLIAEATPKVRRAVNIAIEALRATGLAMGAASARAIVDEIDHHALIVMQAESARVHPPARFAEGQLSATLRKRLLKGEAITDTALAESLSQRARLATAFFDAAGGADIALLPVMPFEAPLAAQTDPSSPSFAPRIVYRMSSLTRFVNYLGLPALSLPCGFDERGVPIGLQVIGRPDSEAQLLALAARLQAATDWHGRVPPVLSHATSERHA